MGKSTNRQYTLEFKEQAVELAQRIGITRASEKLGVNMANVQRWKSKAEKEETPSKKVKVDLEEENRRLHAEVVELKKINHILKSAAAFFSRDHLK